MARALIIAVALALCMAVSAQEAGTATFIRSSLVLNDVEPAAVQIPNSNANGTVGGNIVYWANVRCGPSGGDIVGNCAWTGVFLSTAGEGEANYNVVCTLTSRCGKFGTGTIVAVGRGTGISPAASRLAVVGGTGQFALKKFSLLDWENNVYTFRF